MKTRDNNIIRLVMTIPQGREPFHLRKLTGPTASLMGVLNHERDMENKDRGLTTLSGSGSVTDVAGHRC